MLLNIVDLDAPLHPTPARSAEIFHLAETWDTHVGEIRYTETADAEKFIEQAVRLQSALYNVEDVWLTVNASTTATNLRTGDTKPVSELDNQIRYGMQSSPDLTLSANLQMKAETEADGYASWESFQTNANRAILLAGFGVEKGLELSEALLQMQSKGIKEVFIKATQAKAGIWSFALPANLTKDKAEELLMDELDWALIRNEGREDAFLVQEKKSMFFEYRFFVVNHTPVTGAGVIPQFTPLENTAVFDPQMRYEAGSDPIVNPGKVESYRRFVDAVTADVKREHPHLYGYVVDVASNSEGEPLVVEFNSLLNSGLYASAVDNVVIGLDTRL